MGGHCLRARDGEFRAPARVPFFFCKKKGTKENHSNLRFKDPLARYGLCKIGGADLAELVRWVTLLSVQGSLVPLAPLPLTLCEGTIGCAGGVGDYQIAPIAARSTAMGRWRLTPPGYGGTCLPAGRFAGLTRHRRIIQYRDPSRGNAWGCSGRSEKCLPWLKQAVAEASAPVSVHAVLLTDNGDERLCPREDAGNHSRP